MQRDKNTLAAQPPKGGVYNINSKNEWDDVTISSPPFRGLGGRYILSSAYFAPISYYKIIAGNENIFIEGCENYVKQTYRNRCKIASANGVMSLNIPVESNGGEKILIKDVRISEHDNWQIQHWRSIESAYRSSPFFEYYEDDLRPFFEKKLKYLWDFNWEIMQKILHLLDFQCKIKITDEYQDAVENDFRELIHPKKESVVSIEKYYQVFEQKHGFLNDLSIIDLLFNMGNESILVLNK